MTNEPGPENTPKYTPGWTSLCDNILDPYPAEYTNRKFGLWAGWVSSFMARPDSSTPKTEGSQAVKSCSEANRQRWVFVSLPPVK